MSLWQTLLVIDIVIAIYNWVAYAYIEVGVKMQLIELIKTDNYKNRKMSFLRIIGYILAFIIGTIIFLIPILNLWLAYGAAVNKEHTVSKLVLIEYENFLKRKEDDDNE